MIAAPLFQKLLDHYGRAPEYLGPADAVSLVNEGGRLFAQVRRELVVRPCDGLACGACWANSQAGVCVGCGWAAGDCGSHGRGCEGVRPVGGRVRCRLRPRWATGAMLALTRCVLGAAWCLQLRGWHRVDGCRRNVPDAGPRVRGAVVVAARPQAVGACRARLPHSHTWYPFPGGCACCVTPATAPS